MSDSSSARPAGSCLDQEQLVVLGGGFMNSEAAAARSGSGMNMSSSSSSSSMMIGMLSSTGSDRDMDLLQSFDLQQFPQLPSCTSSSDDHRRRSSCSTMNSADGHGGFYAPGAAAVAAAHGQLQRPDMNFMINYFDQSLLMENNNELLHMNCTDVVGSKADDEPGEEEEEEEEAVAISASSCIDDQLAEILLDPDLRLRASVPQASLHNSSLPAVPEHLQYIRLGNNQRHQLLHAAGADVQHRHLVEASRPAAICSSSQTKNRMQPGSWQQYTEAVVVQAASTTSNLQPLQQLRHRRGLSFLNGIQPVQPPKLVPPASVIRSSAASAEIISQQQQQQLAVSPFCSNNTTRPGACSSPSARTKNATNSTSNFSGPDQVQHMRPSAGTLECNNNIEPLVSPCSVLTSPRLISKLDNYRGKSYNCRGAAVLHELQGSLHELLPSPTASAAERPHDYSNDNKRLQAAEHGPVMSMSMADHDPRPRVAAASGASLSARRNSSETSTDAAAEACTHEPRVCMHTRPKIRKRMRPAPAQLINVDCCKKKNITGIVDHEPVKKMVQQQLQSQRMTHIAVERNRRKQMNENLGTLRALMPGSYVPKGDQASIIGSAIEFVKELEQLLQCLQAQKKRRSYTSSQLNNNVMQSSTRSNSVPMIMSPSGIIIKPNLGGLLALTLQPGAAAAAAASSAAATAAFQDLSSTDMKLLPEAAAAVASESDQGLVLAAGAAAETNSKSEMANVEVKAVGSNAWIKVLAQRRSPGQLLRTMATLEESLDLSILHCNITTVDNTVLYSFHVWIGNKCLSTVEEIAAAIQHNLLQNITI